MATSERAGTFTSICDNCPKRRALLEQMSRVQDETNCPADNMSYVQHVFSQIGLLAQAAEITGCKNLDKELPGPEVEVPRLGKEWGDLGRQCLSHEAFVQLIKEGN